MLYGGEIKSDVAKIYLYHIFALKYGWTPEVVDNLDYWTVRGLIAIMKAENEKNKGEMVERKLMREFGGMI